MKAAEEITQAKISKSATSAPEAPTMPSYPDWTTSMQAYYGAGATPPPFFASTVASPTPHPYMWGGQHALIPPYGTPVPYPAMYPPGGVYAHPNMAPQLPNTLQTHVDFDGKAPNGKDKPSARKTKGSGSLLGKVMENGKAASGSGNDGVSHSAESGSSGSSEASDENSNEQERAAIKNGQFKQMLADGNSSPSQGSGFCNCNYLHNLISSSANAPIKIQVLGNIIQAPVPWKPSLSLLTTNLNVGMDLWNSSPAGTAAASAKMRSNPSGASSTIVAAAIPEQWMHQDERELKRQKRKQSNRESARRSRLRKQAECEDLQTRVQSLSDENRDLRDELQKLAENCEKLKSENDSIKEELTRIHGPDAVAGLELGNPSLTLQSRNAEGNS